MRHTDQLPLRCYVDPDDQPRDYYEPELLRTFIVTDGEAEDSCTPAELADVIRLYNGTCSVELFAYWEGDDD